MSVESFSIKILLRFCPKVGQFKTNSRRELPSQRISFRHMALHQYCLRSEAFPPQAHSLASTRQLIFPNCLPNELKRLFRCTHHDGCTVDRFHSIGVQLLKTECGSQPPDINTRISAAALTWIDSIRIHDLLASYAIDHPYRPRARLQARGPAGFSDQQRDSARKVGHRIVIGRSPTLRHPWRPLSRSRLSGAPGHAATVDLACAGTPYRMICERVSA